MTSIPGRPGSGTAGIPESSVTNLVADLAAKAPLASPAFTGTVTLPNATIATSSPSAPSSGSVALHAMDVAGRAMLAGRSPLGRDAAISPHLGMTARLEWIPTVNGSTPTVIGGVSPAVTGTPTSRIPAAGSFYSWARRTSFLTTGASSGLSCGIRANVAGYGFGDVAGGGGFLFVCRFGVSDGSAVANARLFVGLIASASVIGNVEPSSLTNIIGVGADAGEANLSILNNDSSGTATKTSLGVNFPANTRSTDVYELVLYCAPNGSTVGYRVTRLNTGDVAPGSISSDLPSTSTLLAPQVWRNNGTTAVQAAIDLMGLYIESDI